jgi:hypothetical protein
VFFVINFSSADFIRDPEWGLAAKEFFGGTSDQRERL